MRTTINPYPDDTLNRVYNLLFCEDVGLYKSMISPPYDYPFDSLFSEEPAAEKLESIRADEQVEERLKILADSILREKGSVPEQSVLRGVIVEVGLEYGLDVLAVYRDFSARYINQTGKIMVWEETQHEDANTLVRELFARSENIIRQIGPWNQPRRPQPEKGVVRISFLVSDGLYFGEGPMQVLFDDPLASGALDAATRFLEYLIDKAEQTH